VLDVKDCYRETPLQLAAHREKHDIVRILLNKAANPNLINESLNYPLRLAARKRNAAIIHLLWEHSSLMNVTTEYGETALHILARHGGDELVRLLLMLKVDPKTANEFSRTNQCSGFDTRY